MSGGKGCANDSRLERAAKAWLDRAQRAWHRAAAANDRATPSEPAATDAARGESIAASWLEAQGYRIAARNLRLGPDEADLVAIVPGPGKVVAIVEVKTSRLDGHAASRRIDAGKRRRLIRLARRLQALEPLREALIRFDAIGVDLSVSPPLVLHTPGFLDVEWPSDRLR